MITLSFILLSAASSVQAQADECELPHVENSRAKKDLIKQTRLIYVRPDTPNVPDDNPNTVQFMVMAKSDDRPSHVSDDGQVMFLRADTVHEKCGETFTRLLDESYDKRLRLLGQEKGG